MKVAKEKVWADSKGNAVPDGHEDAAFLIAGAGQTVPDSHVDQFKGADKYFKDAVFDSDGKQSVAVSTAEPTPTPVTYHLTKDHEGGPEPRNREDEMPKRRKRTAKAKKAVAKK